MEAPRPGAMEVTPEAEVGAEVGAEVNAAVVALLERSREGLRAAASELDARSRIAARYTQALGIARPQVMASDVVSTWAQYTIRIADGGREAFMAGMRAAGIPTVIYYQRPLHGQTAYRAHPIEGGHLPVTEMLCREVVSLPMHAYLDASVQDRIIETALHLLGGRNAAAA